MKSLFRKVLGKIAGWFGIHPSVGTMLSGGFRLANPDSAAMPVENLHFASRIIASGMWNYCFFQFYRHFAGPYWVERQYNPRDPSFIPRAIQPLSVNITHRTWMGFRGPDASHFSIMDPAGAVSPVTGYYSLEFALRENDKLLLPGRGEARIKQSIPGNLPMPRAVIRGERARVDVRVAGSSAGGDFVLFRLDFRAPHDDDVEVVVGVRPFNPEGATLIHDLELERKGTRNPVIKINKQPEVYVLSEPTYTRFSNLRKGDAYFLHGESESSKCPDGIATGLLAYRVRGSGSIMLAARAYERLENGKAPAAVFKQTKGLPENPEALIADMKKGERRWSEQIRRGARFQSARSSLNRAAEIFSSYLLTLRVKNEITPGVFTYRSFFFRDAAFMLDALMSWNYINETERVLESYPERQTRQGFFRSQEGEWDSNGQAIWSLTRFASVTGNLAFLRKMYPSIQKGARWILTKRESGRDKRILPPGFSAEHLGPADNYYWDNFWSIAGLRAAAEAAEKLELKDDAREFSKQAEIFARDINEVSRADREKMGLITAAPGRAVDSGMIGSISMLYPLMLDIFPRKEVRKTITTIHKEFFAKGLFFHPIIHSGFNIYLSLHVAQCLFRLGEIRKARRIFNRVLKRRSALWTYPEAIHPQTGGGVMGDGFHGWAYAEVLLLMREFTVHMNGGTLEIFQGLRKRELFGRPVSFGPFPLAGTAVTIAGRLSPGAGRVELDIPNADAAGIQVIRLHIPGLKKAKLNVNGGHALINKGKIEIRDPASRIELEYS